MVAQIGGVEQPRPRPHARAGLPRSRARPAALRSGASPRPARPSAPNARALSPSSSSPTSCQRRAASNSAIDAAFPGPVPEQRRRRVGAHPRPGPDQDPDRPLRRAAGRPSPLPSRGAGGDRPAGRPAALHSTDDRPGAALPSRSRTAPARSRPPPAPARSPTSRGSPTRSARRRPARTSAAPTRRLDPVDVEEPVGGMRRRVPGFETVDRLDEAAAVAGFDFVVAFEQAHHGVGFGVASTDAAEQLPAPKSRVTVRSTCRRSCPVPSPQPAAASAAPRQSSALATAVPRRPGHATGLGAGPGHAYRDRRWRGCPCRSPAAASRLAQRHRRLARRVGRRRSAPVTAAPGDRLALALFVVGVDLDRERHAGRRFRRCDRATSSFRIG